jgi:hypothetical protein
MAVLNEAENQVTIEGLLSEIDINPVTFTKDGTSRTALSGVVKIRVDGQKINGVTKTLEVPIHVFASMYKKDGKTINPAYTSVSNMMETFKSIAAVGIDEADAVAVTGGKIVMNEFYPAGSTTLVSTPRVSCSFFRKLKVKEAMKPCATFAMTFVVGDGTDEIDAAGNDTGRYKITAILPQYGGKVDVVPLIAEGDNIVNAVRTYWSNGDTVRTVGKLNFSQESETVLKEVDFGEPQEVNRTIFCNELIITGGSQVPVTGSFAYEMDDINAALAERKARLTEKTETTADKPKKGPALKVDAFGF